MHTSILQAVYHGAHTCVGLLIKRCDNADNVLWVSVENSEGIDEEVEYKLSIDIFLIAINVAVAIYAAKQIAPLTALIKYCKARKEKKKVEKEHRAQLRRQRSPRSLSDADKTDVILRNLTVVAPKFPETHDGKGARQRSFSDADKANVILRNLQPLERAQIKDAVTRKVRNLTLGLA